MTNPFTTIQNNLKKLNSIKVPKTGLGLYDLSAKSIIEMNNDNLGAYAGNMTYSGIFTIFPFLLFLLSLLAVFHATGLTHEIFNWTSGFLPRSAAKLVQDSILVIAQTRAKGSFTLGAILTLLLSVWGVSGGMRATMTALNAMYDAQESRPFWKVWGVSILLALFVPVLLVVAILLVTLSGTLLTAIGIGGPLLYLVVIVKWPILVLAILVAFSVLYYFGPDVSQPFRLISVGSIFSATAWIVFSVIFSVYTNNFGSYDATYGTLAGIILLLLYMYYSAYVFLLGGEINQVVGEHLGIEKPRKEKYEQVHD